MTIITVNKQEPHGELFKLVRGSSYTREVGFFRKRWQTRIMYTFTNLVKKGSFGNVYISRLTEDEIRETCESLGFEFSNYQKPHVYADEKNAKNLERLCKTLEMQNHEKIRKCDERHAKQNELQRIVDEIEQKNLEKMSLKDVYCGRHELKEEP